MDDSWPASPRAEELSDSISSHAAEVERTLRALEAVEAFRAEAAALRAELQAARVPPIAQPVARRMPAPELPPSTWRLIIEAGLLVGVALVCWGIHLHRLEIVLVMAGAWLLVALLEAGAWRRSEGAYPVALPPRPAAHAVAAPLPAPAPAPAPAAPALRPVPAVSALSAVWPERSETAQPTTVLPLPEPEPEPPPPAALVEDDSGPERPRVRLPRLRLRRKAPI